VSTTESCGASLKNEHFIGPLKSRDSVVHSMDLDDDIVMSLVSAASELLISIVASA
jgi:hypothetical protein